MPRIRITGILPQAKYGIYLNSPNGGDDDWIRKIMEYEAKQGGYDESTGKSYGLSNWGYNNWQKFGHSAAPKTIDEAIQYFKQDYLPKFQNYPDGLRERLADYSYNTGRSVNDLLLYNAGDRKSTRLNSSH